MAKGVYVKQTIRRNDFISLDEMNYLDDTQPYNLGIKTRSGSTYHTVACFSDRSQAEQAYNVLSQTIQNVIRYEKKH